MTVATETAFVSYAGDGTTTAFPVTFPFLANSHLLVTLIAADGTATTQTITTHYTVASSTVTMLTAPAVGQTLVITRNVPATQETDYRESDSFPADSHERALDKLTMLVQQNKAAAAASVRLPVFEDPADYNVVLPAEAARAGKYVAMDDDGNLVMLELTDIGTAVLSDAVPGDVATTGAAGSSAEISRSDHVHAVNIVADTTPQLGGQVDTNGHAINESEGTAVASATAPNIWATNGNTVHITGTTTITDFANAPRVGAWRKLIFDGILTLTHGSGITLPGSANITTAAGDIAFVYADAVDAFRVVYFKASGEAVVAPTPATPVFSESYESAGQAITAGGALTLAHGLSSTPHLILSYLVMGSTTEHGYSDGDVVPVHLVNDGGAGSARGVSCVADATNLNIRIGSATSSFQLLKKDTGAVADITNARWTLIMRAWA